MTMTHRIKSYRAKNNLSQAQFAHLIGVTQGLINHWETQRQQPSASMALTIEKATAGKLTARELRPDLPWPEPRSAAREDAAPN